ncbi:nucleosome remodeling subunit caf1 nurf55 msi1 [Phaffia rhodozyma]|uniref:Nucleosome remodeling subunit caf1 nurf55 msi1 n=1 Tax=Phaffia rhodozyma TaxID=264483 RepID=A0A0F7SRT9_PHARH|nr:nucleosome remodeling subunit caf1 nurf55 msi1 [Phaffia rhodozyma]
MASSLAPIQVDDDEVDPSGENQVINEEYKIWKKNTPFLYDQVLTHAMTWPSLTCQWFPDVESPPNADYTLHRLLLGTHTSGQAQDQLIIAQVQIPNASSGSLSSGLAEYDEDRGELGSHAGPSARVTAIQTINHDGEINRARYMPQNPNLLATKTVSGDVCVFDRTKHSSEASADGVSRPDLRLKGQSKEGYGLCWNPVKSGHVLSASEDTTVCHWDINGYSKTNNSLDPIRVYRGHTSIVEDVAWHNEHDYLFASCGDDRQLMIWDTREDGSVKPRHQIEAHQAEINAVAFSPSSSNLLLTASGDKTIGLWDLRKLSVKLHSFESHSDEVIQLAWSPHNETVFASSSSDRRVNIWDLSKIGDEQTPEDADDGPPELLFVHGGHTSKPSDLSWNPNVEWGLSSTSEDNIVMIWQPSQNFYAGDLVDIRSDELE